MATSKSFLNYKMALACVEAAYESLANYRGTPVDKHSICKNTFFQIICSGRATFPNFHRDQTESRF